MGAHEKQLVLWWVPGRVLGRVRYAVCQGGHEVGVGVGCIAVIVRSSCERQRHGPFAFVVRRG